jgi:hypothetical protein
MERTSELTAVLPELPAGAAWRLYTAIPGLLTATTLQVAQRLKGLSAATGRDIATDLVPHMAATNPRLAFLAPGTAASRVGLAARLARLPLDGAVSLLQQHPPLWSMSSSALGPRWGGGRGCVPWRVRGARARHAPDHTAKRRAQLPRHAPAAAVDGVAHARACVRVNLIMRAGWSSCACCCVAAP